MAKRQIWLFGDSYSSTDPNHAHLQYCWPYKLSRMYSLVNFSISGTGPDYQFLKLQDRIQATKNIENLKSVTLIFFMSNDSRKNFSFLRKVSDACFMVHTAMDTEDSSPTMKYRKEEYREHKPFLKKFFKTYYSHNNKEELSMLKNVAFLKEISKLFNKVLVIPVFDMPYGKLHEKFTLNVEPTPNFHVAEGPTMYDVSKDLDPNYFSIPNHLPHSHHDIMLNALIDWIEEDNLINTNIFKNKG